MSETVNSSLRTAVKGTALILFGLAVSLPLWFATKVLIVRNTTKEEFGIYSLALAIAGLLVLFANLGLQEGVTRYISIFLGEGRRDDADAVSRASLRTGLISGAAAFALMYSLSGLMARHVFYLPELETPLKVISFSILFAVMSQNMGAILRGHNIIRPKVYYLDVGSPLFFLLFLGVVLILRLPFISIVYAYVFSMALVLIAIGSYCYRKTGLNTISLRGGRHGKELLKFSVPLLIGSFMVMVLRWTDTLMLGRYMGAEDVGTYNISITLARLLTFSMSAIMFVWLPLAGDMYARNELSELKKTYQVLTKWIFSATLPLFFVLFFFPEMTITSLFGDRFIDAAIPLRILSIGFLINVFFGANGTILMVRGMSKQIMNVSVFGAVLNVVLNYILIKRLGYGIIGASVATALSYTAISILIAVMLFMDSGIQPVTTKYLRPVAGSAVVALIIYAVAKSLPLYFWMLPLYFVLFILGYFFSVLITRSITKEDIEMLEAIYSKTGMEMKLAKRIIYFFVPDQDRR